ncbi:hypothetical protein DVR12_26985 [Chitinophaga silvatica]|uniref:START domain-containing protein n=1 Tax=Chitinophaga silvatica TaxID=2282649 RepID=A0A3E1Y220_9BACT|nr:hypothetical protein [Chitinophaga silvatica]RFS18693.1 hypothetical protein DVR12_26985 [Chitinophaga silvatica]
MVNQQKKVFKYSMMLFVCLLFSKSGFCQNSTDSVSYECIKVTEFEYLLLFRNNSTIDLWLPEIPVIKHSLDTLWIDNTWGSIHQTPVYIYKIDSTIFETEVELSDIIQPISKSIRSSIIPNAIIPGKLMHVGQRETKTLRFYYNDENFPSTIVSLRVFSSPIKKAMLTKVVDQEYIEFASKYSTQLIGTLNSAHKLR